MKIYVSIFLISCAFSLSNCKKTKLKDDYALLVGEWRWIGGYNSEDSEGYLLNLKSKGKFKLCKGNKTLESGRMLLENNELIFNSDNFFRKKYYDRLGVKSCKNDTLILTRLHSVDVPIIYFVKK